MWRGMAGLAIVGLVMVQGPAAFAAGRTPDAKEREKISVKNAKEEAKQDKQDARQAFEQREAEAKRQKEALEQKAQLQKEQLQAEYRDRKDDIEKSADEQKEDLGAKLHQEQHKLDAQVDQREDSLESKMDEAKQDLQARQAREDREAGNEIAAARQSAERDAERHDMSAREERQVSGTITSINPMTGQLALKQDGSPAAQSPRVEQPSINMALDRNTTVLSGSQMLKPQDLQVGDRVKVKFTTQDGGKHMAQTIWLDKGYGQPR